MDVQDTNPASDSDWDDESTLDFAAPRHENRYSLTNRRPIVEANEKLKPTPKERNFQEVGDGFGMDGDAQQRKVILSRPVDEDSKKPPYDFSGALHPNENQKVNNIVEQPQETKGGRYNAPKSPTPPPSRPESPSVRVQADWDDSDAEEQTLRDLNTTLKKEKQREYNTEQQRIQEKEEKSQASEVSYQDNGRKPFTGKKSSSFSRLEVAARPEYDRPIKRPDSFTRHDNRDRVDVGSSSIYLQSNKEMDHERNKAEHYNDRIFTSDDVIVVNNIESSTDQLQSYLPVVCHDEKGARILYRFQACDMAVYQVPDEEIDAVMPGVADKAEKAMRRFWLEVFGSLRLIFSIVTIFIVEASNFLLQHVVRPVTIGILTSVGNHFIKPLLSLTFSMIVQPFVVFLYNMLTGVRHLSQPIVDIARGLLSPVAMVLSSFRLVDVTYKRNGDSERRIRNI